MTLENASVIIETTKKKAEVKTLNTVYTDEYDYSEILGKLRAKNITQNELAHIIGLNPSTINLKFNNKSEFTQSQMRKIVAAVDEPVSTIGFYFYTHKLAKTQVS